MTSGMPPTFMPIIGTIRAKAGRDWLAKRHATPPAGISDHFRATFAHHMHHIQGTVHLGRMRKKK
jgi:hypothetical protein